MKPMIIAVGGTGQLLLHYYAQLYALGVMEDSFLAYVIDSDELMPSLAAFQDFFHLVAEGATEEFVPEIHSKRIAAPSGANVREAVTGNAAPTEFHEAEAFFSEDSLRQSVRDGLYARPCLSAVMASDWDLSDIRFGDVDRVLVVGSIVGGTGGGSIAPLLAELPEQFDEHRPPALVTLLFGNYFDPDPAKMPDGRTRFTSNRLLVARMLAEIVPPELRYVGFIEPKNKVARDVEAERRAVHLPWYSREHPYWLGVCGAKQLLREATNPTKGSFVDRELEIDPQTIDRGQAELRLRRRLGIVDAFIRHDVLRHAGSDAFVQQIWGTGFTDLVRSLYRPVSRIPALGLTNPRNFTHRVSQRLARMWDTVGLRFPIIGDPYDAKVRDLRLTNWGAPLRHLSEKYLHSPERVADTSAAVILHRMLRGEPWL
jgi:hypothetical protein